MVFFTSDTHAWHKNIVAYEPGSRGKFLPFEYRDLQPAQIPTDVLAEAAERMTDEIIRRHNAVVAPEDTVYHLGDVVLGGKANFRRYRERVNGRIVLIKGNHDYDTQFLLDQGFDEVHKELTFFAGAGTTVWMHHQPVMDPQAWPTRADYHLCGHVHSSWARQVNVINVGVDVSNLYPLTLQQLLVRDLVVCEWCRGEKVVGKGKACPECFGLGNKINSRFGRAHRGGDTGKPS